MQKFARQACHFEKQSAEKSFIGYKKRRYRWQGGFFETNLCFWPAMVRVIECYEGFVPAVEMTN